jgi:hypothetical protein
MGSRECGNETLRPARGVLGLIEMDDPRIVYTV